MSSGKDSKTSSVAIPPWIAASLKPYLQDTMNKNRTFADMTWEGMMGGVDPNAAQKEDPPDVNTGRNPPPEEYL